MGRGKSLLNQKKIMKCGMECTVIDDKGYKDITVKFDDGTIVEHTQRRYFVNGSLSNPSLGRNYSRTFAVSTVGQTKMMNCGMKCTVLKDKGIYDVTVEFEDGTVREGCSRAGFKNGTIANPSLGIRRSITNATSIVGQTNMMNCGMKCTVIEDNGQKNIIVEFEDGTKKKSTRYDFRKGNIGNENYIKGSILGETAVMNCGMTCTVIEDKGSRDISVQFEDGTLVEHIRRSYFKSCSISHPVLGRNYARINASSIYGQSKVMRCGMNCTVIKDEGAQDITVQFEDGTIVEGCARSGFKKGSLINPTLGRGYAYSKEHSIVGQTKLMHCGMKCTVIEDNGADDITVQFEDGTIVEHRIRNQFIVRGIANPNLMNSGSIPQGILYYYIHEFFDDAEKNYRPDWLKNNETGLNFEIDIWIPSIKTGIEYDGVAWHSVKTDSSEKKKNLIVQSKEIEKLITVLERGAVKNESHKHINIQLVSTSDRKESEKFYKELENALNEILKILGISEYIQIEEDIIEKMYEASIFKVYSQNLRRGENDLETLRPDLAEEWDYNNNTFFPSDVTTGSGREVNWICSKCGHKWPARILNRARKNGTGCPKCGKKQNFKNRWKKIINIDTGVIYESIVDASDNTGVGRNSICACCNKRKKTAGGYRWQYYNGNDK